ncbi:hypothetical protein FOA43_000456 [Brettanomyces nanus]|uniref:Uncharacterized protein n=1 Tax=Eeniella nana TaxID=13502 RepID=A0A875RN40_EENNA|nr:uncharacterized protein FOA43_000456 [Brettanomyces nanus]QPG73150.1 hypothetical protein FOA43_000456 [Brettanomyces nanus]
MISLIAEINRFNSNFPLVTYAPIDNVSESFDSLESKREFKLVDEEEEDNGNVNQYTKFKLGVYNVLPFNFDENILVTVDPLCFFALLLLASRSGCYLPKLGPDTNSAGYANTRNGSIVSLAFGASPDGELPILIEDEIDKITKTVKRKVRRTTVVNKFALASVTDTTELMYIKLVDTRLFDFYISRLTLTKDKSLIMRLYSLSGIEEKQQDISEKLVYPSVMAHLVSRFQFDLRNPSIASAFNTGFFWFPSWIRPKYYTQSINEEYQRCKDEGIEALLQFERVYNDAGQKGFFFGSETNKPSVFDYKLAAMVYCILDLAEFVDEFAQVKVKCPGLAFHCAAVMKTVMK